MTAAIVMGVCGCGKTVVAQALAFEAKGEFVDADDVHPKENVAKMTSGEALTDEDRLPWLMKLHEQLAVWIRKRQFGVLACSALKKAYRNILRFGSTSGSHLRNESSLPVVFVHLKGSYELISCRMSQRTDHYMPASLLRSQFDILEEPGEDEPTITVSIEDPVNVIIHTILKELGDCGFSILADFKCTP